MNLIILTITALTFTSCVASRLPDEMKQNQLSAINGYHYKCSVAVDAYEIPIYSNGILTTLAKSGLFDHVAPSAENNNSEFIARVTEPINAAPFPIAAILTLGIISSEFNRPYGYKFRLERRSDKKTRKVNAAYVGESWFGWIAFPLMFFPGCSAGNPKDSTRYMNYFKQSVIKDADDILKYYKNNP